MKRHTAGGVIRTALVYTVIALVLGYFVPRIEVGANALVDRDQMIAFLSSVSSGMMAFTGIAFALLFIMLQFVSTAYSPQIVPMLVRSATLRHAAGVFTGTFLYALMALRGVGAAGGHTTMLTTWTVFLWLLGSVFLLLRLVDVFGSLALTDLLQTLSGWAHQEIDRVYGPPGSRRPKESAHHPRPGPPQCVMHRGPAQYVSGFDKRALVELARKSDAIIHLGVAIGDPSTYGTCLVKVEHRGPPLDEERIRRAVVLSVDRTREQGPKYAIRLLVDIAIRALSPAINDPTTAVRVLDQLEGVLARLAESNLEVGRICDDAGDLRVVYPATSWEEYLDLAVTEIQDYGAASVQVERRLAALFAFLHDTVSDRRRGAVDRHAAEREEHVEHAFRRGRSRERAEEVDREGLGHPILE